nr:putative ribonuclease H-like domain-containing protein [Tanacetum cinerariifolium]
MATMIEQQVALDKALVPSTKRLKKYSKKDKIGSKLDKNGKPIYSNTLALFLQLVDERLLLIPKQTPPEVDKHSCTSLLLDLLAQKECTDERDDIINIVSLRKKVQMNCYTMQFNPFYEVKTPITAENKVNKTTGPKEANHSAAKNGDEKLNEDTDSKTNEELVDQGDQAFLEDLERIKRQEKEATDAAETLRKTFAQSTEGLLLQAGAARASSINFVNTATTPVNAASTPTNQDASQIPALEILMQSGYRRGLIDKTLFIKKDKKDIITPIEIKKPLVKDEKAADVTSKTSHLQAVKRIFRHLKGKPKLGLWYPRDSSFNLKAYSDSDYAGANLDRKSTTRGCQFLGRILISWQCKKQKIIATSTTEAEYVAAASY